jgi:type VI protein secretion system component Hcp
MRNLILALLLTPVLSFAQNSTVYIKLTDGSGQLIKGETLAKGFERTIQAGSTSAAGKNNTQFSFTTTISGASADLKKAMANKQLLPTGEVTSVVPNGMGAPQLSYTIKMEQITVLSCTESMGCNGIMNTVVSLQATRIGWTYYTANRSGAVAVSRKFGWDAVANTEWNNF